MPTLKEQVLNCKCTRQSDSEALANINHYLSDAFILASLRRARAGSTYDGHNGLRIGITQTEFRVLGEHMGREDGALRRRFMVELPAEGVSASYGEDWIGFSLMGDPTPPKPQSDRYPDLR